MTALRGVLQWARREKLGKLRPIFDLYRWLRFNILPAIYQLAIALGVKRARGYEALARLAQADYQSRITSTGFDTEAADRIGARALSYYESALTIDPERLDLYEPYSTMLLTMGRAEQALQMFRRWFSAQDRFAERHQLDRLGIRFVDRVVATSGIGAMAFLDPYVKAGILGLRPPRHEVLLLTPDQPVPNPHFLSYWRKYVTIIDDPVATSRLMPLVPYLEDVLHCAMRCGDRLVPYLSAAAYAFQRWESEGRPPLLTLSQHDHERGWAALERAGVPPGAWFVCVHVREAGFKDGGGSHDQFRNSDISTYLTAIRTIVNRGGWVIRMGNPTMTPLPKMERVIDYALSEHRSDWMDVFLSASCRFFINNSSGPGYMASAFGVPHVLTNYLPTWSIIFQGQDTFIPKLCWHVKEERYLTFRELMGPPVSTGVLQHQYDQLGVKPVENTAEEIDGLILEALDRSDGCAAYSADDERLQEEFRSLTADCGTLYGLDNFPIFCRIGRGFLKKHAALLPAMTGVEEAWTK